MSPHVSIGDCTDHPLLCLPSPLPVTGTNGMVGADGGLSELVSGGWASPEIMSPAPARTHLSRIQVQEWIDGRRTVRSTHP